MFILLRRPEVSLVAEPSCRMLPSCRLLQYSLPGAHQLGVWCCLQDGEVDDAKNHAHIQALILSYVLEAGRRCYKVGLLAARRPWSIH